MGIPSYFRFLCNENPKIIQKTYHKNGKVILCLDFNCIVYYCLSKMKINYDGSNIFTYEKALINTVCDYVETIWKESGCCEEVFIAVDGVVPMAKMKQQRLRRFKSTVLEQYEVQQGVRNADEPKWDKNAITPGTRFMKTLHKGLEDLCKKHTKWTLSGYNKPGEGEHKVMKYIRDYDINNTFLVYGLDADLILLSMLHSDLQNIFLLREEMEFNRVVLENKKEQYLYLNINALNSTLFTNPCKQYILDYIVMMSLLGNDFLPHSLSFTIKDGGYTTMFELLKQFHINNKYLTQDNSINWIILKEYITCFYQDETHLTKEFCRKKEQIKFFRTNKQTSTEYELKMAPIYLLPCKWFVEKEIYNGDMIEGWEEKYYETFLIPNKEKILSEYVYGLQWILDYYIGNAIDIDWYYPWMYTPLWKDVVRYLNKVTPNIHYNTSEYIEPEQQLALVLPKQSYNLIENVNYKKFITLYPQYYPDTFGFHSLGKKWFYECESNIPIFSTRFLRNVLKDLKN